MFTVDMVRLRAKLHEVGKTPSVVAREIDMDKSTFYRKMKTSGGNFSIGEVHRIAEAVPLSGEEAIKIFLSQNSQ